MVDNDYPDLSKPRNRKDDEYPDLSKSLFPNKSFLQKANDVAGKFNDIVEGSRLPAAAGGLLQGTGDAAASLGNLFLKPINKEMGTNINIPHPNLGKYIPNDLASKSAFMGGEVGSAFIPGAGWGKAAEGISELGGITNNISKIPLIGKMIAPGVGGAAAGYALGENQEGDRTAATVAGGALGTVIAAAKKLELGDIVKSFFNKAVPKDVVRIIQNKYDSLLSNASQKFNNVADQVVKRNVGKIPIDDKHLDDIIKNKHLPDTIQSQKLIENARTGDYQAVRDLQSDLRYWGDKANESELIADQHKGREIHDLRNKINESLAGHLENTGNKDLADQLRDAMKQYRDLNELYFGEDTPRAIKNMVKPGLRKTPNNVLSVLSEDSEPVKKIVDAHPEIKPLMEVLKKKDTASKVFNKLLLTGVGGVTGGATVSYGPSIINKLLGRSSD